MSLETSPITAKDKMEAEDTYDGSNYVNDALIDAIWQDLEGRVTRDKVYQVAYDVAADFHDATVIQFIPILIRRRASMKLRKVLARGE